MGDDQVAARSHGVPQAGDDPGRVLSDLAGWGDWTLNYAVEIADAVNVEVPPVVRLAAAILHGWAADLAERADDAELPHAGPVELFPEPPISPN